MYKEAMWEDKYNDGDWHCSNCGAIVEKDEQGRHNWYYCYHCGAKMSVGNLSYWIPRLFDAMGKHNETVSGKEHSGEHGKWENLGYKRDFCTHPDSITYRCSVCGREEYTLYGFPSLPDVCPTCGAILDCSEVI